MKPQIITSLQNTELEHRYSQPDLLESLSCFQRLLLITDGTVTELLEQYLQESIKVFKLFEKIEENFDHLPEGHETFINSDQMPILKRKVLLQGQSSMKNWLYAESTILLNHLPQGFRTDLLKSQQPIGKLWAKYRIETYKTILPPEKIIASTLAPYFRIQNDAEMISRTYCVYSNQKPIMVITETFPEAFFVNQ